MVTLHRRATATAAEDAALAAIVRSSQDAVIAKTVDGIVTAWNHGAETVYGYPAAAILGQNIEITIPDGALAEERARHIRVAGGLPESGYRCTRVRSDGTPVDVVMSMSPVRDARGHVTGVASISRPVSAAELADARYAALLDAAPDAIVVVGPGGRITDVNPQASAMFLHRKDDLVGAPLEILLPEGLRGQHRMHQATFHRDPRPRAMGAGLSLRAQRRDGSTFPVEISLAPAATTGDGSVIAAVRDVTGLRAFEDALRESELRLRQITEASDVSFLLYQIDPPRFLYLSPGVARLLGRDDAALSGDTASLMDMVHQDDRERVRTEYILPSRAGRPARSNHRVLLPDGSVRWIRAIASPVLRPDGPPERIVMTMEDISADAAASTRLREAETAARGANEAKNNFLSRMSHELRTPLNAVLGFGQLLERPLAGTEHAAAVGHILKGGWHLLDLINDVLDITRIESGEIAVSVEPIPVATLIVEAVELMQPIADEARVALSAQGDVPDAYVLADRQRMRQVLLNLISNAIKYNGREGCVEVSWASVGDQLRLCVRDDGPGIPEHLLGRVFTPFDRLGAEATGVEGAGIGLALTRSLVELMHGTIEVESSAPGGTCFTVTLPAAPPNALVQNGIRDELNLLRTTTPEGGSPPSLRVLYIEDNEPNVLVFEEVLRLRPGWQLIHAGLGALGVELAKAHRPDLILLDLHLPDLPGAEALAALLRVPSTAGTPVVILSADATPAHSKGLLEAGASRYLTKPMRIHEILELLDETAANRGRSSVR